MLKTMIFGAAPLCLMTACAGTGADYTPIVDAPPSRALTQDIAACKGLAQTASYGGPDVQSEAALGAAIGALAGASEDGNWEDALGGAILGAILGGGGKAWDKQDDRKDIVKSCLSQRGHRVVG